MGIPAEIIEQVRQRSSLADLTSGLPKFRRSGKGYIACCPFHEDDNPSLSINDEEGLYNCFACGAKGSLFDYVMKTQNLSFPEAVKFLASQVGITIEETRQSPAQREREREQAEARRRLREICRTAWAVFREELARGSSASGARTYLHNRGVSPELQNAFGLGYAPASWDFLLPKVADKLCCGEKPRFQPEQIKQGLLELGLLKLKKRERSPDALPDDGRRGKADDRDYYDAFRDRVLFPITRSDGAPVAFGGRIISKATDAPKYINCSESPIYQKRRMFFGLSQALSSIRKSDQIYLVEGYLDVLSMHFRGFTNTIAACGTAVADEHVGLLRRLASKVVLLFDGDRAGRQAASRCFELFLNSGIEVKAVMLPEGHDPDSLAHGASREQMKKLFDGAARPVFEVYFDNLLSDAAEAGQSPDPAKLGKAAERSAVLIAGVRNPVERERLARYAAEQLGVGLAAYQELMSSTPANRSFAVNKSRAPGVSSHSVERSGEGRKSEKASNLRVNSGEKTGTFSYWEQILIALISEPKLAARVLKMPLLVSGGQVADSLPDNIRGCIDDLAAKSRQGLASAESAPERQQIGRQLTEILEHWGLNAAPLIAEAERQLSVGGAEPEGLVDDLGLTASRSSLKSEMEQLRSSEAQAGDEESLATIVQRKLEARRNLDRLNLPDRYSKEDSG